MIKKRYFSIMSSNASLLSIIILGGAFLVLMGGCDLDLTNPNAPSEEQVLTTTEGLFSLSRGLIDFYSRDMLLRYINGVAQTTHEVSTYVSMLAEIEIETAAAEALPNNYYVVGIWSTAFQMIETSNQLIENVESVTMDAGTRSGILAMAHLFKAKALGILAQCFEQAPIDVETRGAEFYPRSEVIAKAIQLLEQAIQIISQTPPSGEFRGNIIGANINLENTINAYLARFYLINGSYENAITAANKVDLQEKSVFIYGDRNRNPVWTRVYSLGYTRPRELFGTLETDENDARLEFYLGPVLDRKSVFDHKVHELKGFFETYATPLPVYLPGELLLIKAESYARIGQLETAINYINAVRTKTADDDPFGLGANLPEYDGPVNREAILAEICHQRKVELFLTGLRLEDSRRFNRPGPLNENPERSRNFYPYPTTERTNNPKTPPDPAI